MLRCGGEAKPHLDIPIIIGALILFILITFLLFFLLGLILLFFFLL